MKKLILVIEGGQIQYVFSNLEESFEVEVIDHDSNPKSTTEKEVIFSDLNKNLNFHEINETI